MNEELINKIEEILEVRIHRVDMDYQDKDLQALLAIAEATKALIELQKLK